MPTPAATGCNVEGTKHSFESGVAAKLSTAQIAQNKAKASSVRWSGGL